MDNQKKYGPETEHLQGDILSPPLLSGAEFEKQKLTLFRHPIEEDNKAFTVSYNSQPLLVSLKLHGKKEGIFCETV